MLYRHCTADILKQSINFTLFQMKLGGFTEKKSGKVNARVVIGAGILALSFFWVYAKASSVDNADCSRLFAIGAGVNFINFLFFIRYEKVCFDFDLVRCCSLCRLSERFENSPPQWRRRR